MKKRYEVHWNDGIKFLFAYDEADPTILHIYARHLTSTDLAIEVWWNGEKDVWNTEHNRYETSNDSYTIYWVWLKKDKEVLVITCFKR